MLIRHLLFSLLIVLHAAAVRGGDLTVSAAVSLKESLTQIGTAYEKQTGDRLTFNFDASGKLAAQINQGAPVDLFISADDEQMDKLEKAGKINQKSRRVVIDNSLVLIVSTLRSNIPFHFTDLVHYPHEKIAIGNPQTVPAGRYAMQTFKSLKIDHVLAGNFVMGESVRQVLAYVEQDQVLAGIVYTTDARQGGDKVSVIEQADPKWHDKIEYPASIVAASTHQATAQKFLDFLLTAQAQKVFTDNGFTLPGPATGPTR